MVFLLSLLLLGFMACAGPGTLREGVDPNVITRAEVEAVDVATALEVVERLRPRWLRQPMERSTTRGTQVVLFVNGMLMHDIQSLREISAVNLRRLEWLDSAQAGRMPGLGSRHVAGAIVVETM
jgi:hypothetical protein